MYAASTSYKNYIASSRVRVPKSKIVVGNATYTGQQYLKTYPKISHSNSKMIGGFPAKSCEFEIYNLDGSIDLNGKEVSVYRGLEINGSVTWIPLGLFTAKDEDITNNKTARSISFKGTDRAVLFDCAYGGSLTYPTTLGAFVREICTRHGITLETTTFPMSTFKLTEAPNMDASVTDRELISRAAELGGCIAQISRIGGLRISKPVSTGIQIGKARYKAVSKEPKFGVINSLVFGHDGYDDDITYPSTAPENLCQWRIDDNPFIDKTRESSIKTIAAQIFGMSIVPFQITDCIDDYILDLNDSISVQDKDGTYFTATVLQIETTARIKSKVSAEAQIVKKTDYKMAGSVMQTLKKVQLQVDHQNLSIQTLVQDMNGLSGEMSTLKQTASSIQSKVKKIEGDYVTSSTIEQLSNEINIRFDNLGSPSELSNATTTINAQGIKVKDGSFTAESEGYKADLSSGVLKLYQSTGTASEGSQQFFGMANTLDKLSDLNGKLQYNGSDISVTKNGVINALGYTPQAVSTKVTTGSNITLADNTEYRLTDVTTLTLTYPAGDFECWMRLSFAASGDITVTLPAGTGYIGSAPDFKNGEIWELSFKDKILAAQKVGEGT